MNRRYNQRSPAVRRLMREAIELRDPTPLYHAQPMEDNLFEWHFTIQGPPGTDYEGGRYHGRILLPPEYPMKPPSIVILTPNGRFEMNQKICLSASAYHPEMWQASWGIRTMLLALIGFMPTDGRGTIGSLECTSEARRQMAQRSLNWVCPTCGVANKTALPEPEEEEGDNNNVTKEMEEIVSQMAIKSPEEVDAQFNERQNVSHVQPLPPSDNQSDEPKQSHDEPKQSHDEPKQSLDTSRDQFNKEVDDESGCNGDSPPAGVRYRGQQGNDQQLSPPPPPVPAASNNVILIIIIIIILIISSLIARRLLSNSN